MAQHNSAVVEVELKRLYKKHGMLTPDVLVSEARKSSNPLHSRFEWDDTVAAEKFRREQAYQIIMASRFVIELRASKRAEPEQINVRQFLPEGKKQGHFKMRNTVLNEQEMRAAYVEERLEDLRSWCDQTADIEELQTIRRAILRLLPESE